MRMLPITRISFVTKMYDDIWDYIYETTDLSTESFSALDTNKDGIFDQLRDHRGVL